MHKAELGVVLIPARNILCGFWTAERYETFSCWMRDKKQPRGSNRQLFRMEKMDSVFPTGGDDQHYGTSLEFYV